MKKLDRSIVGQRIGRLFCILFLVFFALVFAMPLYWMVRTALMDDGSVFAIPVKWLPDPVKWDNFVKVVKRMDLAKYTTNTIITSVLPVLGVLFSCPLVA